MQAVQPWYMNEPQDIKPGESTLQQDKVVHDHSSEKSRIATADIGRKWLETK